MAMNAAKNTKMGGRGPSVSTVHAASSQHVCCASSFRQCLPPACSLLALCTLAAAQRACSTTVFDAR